MGFAFVGVGGDGEQGGIGVVASRMRLTVWLSGFRWAGGRRSRARPARGGEAFHGPVVEPGEHHAGLVDLIASAAEILADRAEVGAAADGVFQQPTARDGSVLGAGADAHAQLHLERRADHAGLGETAQASGRRPVLTAGRLARWPVVGR